MRDFENNELQIGDKVICVKSYPNSSCFLRATVIDFTLKFIKVECEIGELRFRPDRVLKYNWK